MWGWQSLQTFYFSKLIFALQLSISQHYIMCEEGYNAKICHHKQDSYIAKNRDKDKNRYSIVQRHKINKLIKTLWRRRLVSSDRKQSFCRQSQSDSDWLHLISNCCLIYKCRQVANMLPSVWMTLYQLVQFRHNLVPLVVSWLHSCRTERLVSTNIIVKCGFMSMQTATDVWFLIIYHR